MFLTDPISAGYVKNEKTASRTARHIMRVLESGNKTKAAKCSKKFVIDSEMGPRDIIRVNKNRDGLPRVLSH